MTAHAIFTIKECGLTIAQEQTYAVATLDGTWTSRHHFVRWRYAAHYLALLAGLHDLRLNTGPELAEDWYLAYDEQSTARLADIYWFATGQIMYEADHQDAQAADLHYMQTAADAGYDEMAKGESTDEMLSRLLRSDFKVSIWPSGGSSTAYFCGRLETSWHVRGHDTYKSFVGEDVRSVLVSMIDWAGEMLVAPNRERIVAPI